MLVTGFNQTIGARRRMQKQDAFNSRGFLVIEKRVAL
jgi:hypothetical protein